MNNKCSHCKNNLSYSERWDAYFCEPCNDWNEKTCSDPDCFFCVNRPQRPVNEWKYTPNFIV